MENIITEKDLMLCAEIGDYENAVKALERGENPNMVNEFGWTPLFLGCHHTELTKLLIQKGADVNAKSENNRSVIHEAVTCGNIDSVMLLLNAGADVNAQENDGWTPLHEAVTGNYVQMIAFLLKAGADATIQYKVDGVDPIHLAVQEGGRILRPFLEYGIDPVKYMVSDLDDFDEGTGPGKCFIDVLEEEFEIWDIYRFLCNHKGQKARLSALKNVIRWGAIKCISAMTDYDWVHLDVKSISERDVSTFIGSSANWEAFLSYLLDRDKDGYLLNLRDGVGDSLLHQAVRLKAYNVIENLIDKGINLEAKNDDGETALALALDLSDIKSIELILTRLCKSWNELPGSMLECFRTLIDEKGVYLLSLLKMQLIMYNAPHLLLNAYIEGINLFQYAIKKGKTSVVNMMLRSQKMGPILSKIDPRSDFSPLYTAVTSDNIEIVKALMEAGADIRQTNRIGDKLLEIATSDEMRCVLQYHENGYNTLLWEALNKGSEMEIYNLICRNLDLMFRNEKGECFFNQLVQKVSTGLLAYVLGMCEYSFNVEDKTTGKSARQYLEELGEEKRLEIMRKYQ